MATDFRRHFRKAEIAVIGIDCVEVISGLPRSNKEERVRADADRAEIALAYGVGLPELRAIGRAEGHDARVVGFARELGEDQSRKRRNGGEVITRIDGWRDRCRKERSGRPVCRDLSVG